MAEKMWLEPEYYESFFCKCGECRHPCCNGWKVAVSEREYYRLIGLNCSRELHAKLEASFEIPNYPKAERFRLIVSDWRGQCRMLDSDGLCMLQKECSEHMLPQVCRLYPRSLKCENGNFQACCSASCEKVVELLLDCERLNFLQRTHTETPPISETIGSNYMSYGKLAIELLQNKSFSLEERIGMLMKESGVELRNPLTIGKLLECSKELESESRTLAEYMQEAHKRYEGYAESPSNLGSFGADIAKLYARFPKFEQYCENLICNNMFYSDFPYPDPRISEKDAVYGVFLQYELLKLACAGYMSSHDTEEDLVDVISGIYHMIEHTGFYYNAKVLIGNR